MLLKKIIEFCVNRSVTIFILGLTILFSGLYGLKTARLDVFPDFAQPQVVIQTEAPGFTSELTELLVSKPIENSLVGVVGVESIRSQSSPGLSVITIIFKESQDILLSRQLISEKLISTISQLPRNVEIPEITPLTSSASSVLGIGITSTDRSLIEQRELVEQIIIPRLIETQGVADISIFGGESRQRQIRIIPESLFKTEISLEEILDEIEKSLGIKPGGYFENSNQRFEILTDSQPQKIKDLESFVIGEVESRPIKISDIATVKDGKGPVSSTANINGQPGIFLMVQAQPKSDTLKLTNALEKKIKELEPTLILEGLILHNGLFRPANFIEEAFSNVQKDILIGATLVLAVLFLFLLNLKTALISAIAIPLSLLSSILILVYQGVALNIMVLGGLVIALGEVVDDAIIDTENIFRRLKENKLKKNPENPLKVVINASMEIRHSVISATVIVVLAFSPLLFIPGVAGRLFEPLGLAYIYALTSSLIIALTITPALCTLLLLKYSSFKTEESPTVLFLKRNYVILLNKIEKAPKEVAATTIFFLLIGLSTIPLFKVEFIPELREGHYIVHMTAVPGTSSAEMNRVGKLVTKKIRNIKNVKSTAQWVGRAENGADTFGMNYSEIQVEVGPLTGSEQEETVNKIKLALTQVDSENKSQPFPGFTFGIHTFLSERIEETVLGYTADFVVEIVGLDLEKIQNDAKKITQIMQKIQGAENVKMVAPSSTPQIKVDILWDKVSAFGLQADEVIRTISTVFHGIQVGEINNNESIYTV